ncbi:hypothetical protein [Changpingibacter yushuensis]|uniref:hypothetical protein n=1 Tax=Changpingibacter yushuensis TaxID=2758440 RepID=UPI00165D6476|nr:hypothetical protein [Changpingibacter yushuensis]
MTPFFKRNRDRRETPQPASTEVVQSAPSASSAEVARAEEPAQAAVHQPSQGAAFAAPSNTPSRQVLVQAAYATWRDELARVAEDASRPFSSVDSSVVDLSSPHPTGSAQLYSGMPTLLSSLVREESALKVARMRLATLKHRIATLSEQYGYAPVTLATAELTWTELPDEPTPNASAAPSGSASAANAGANAAFSASSPSTPAETRAVSQESEWEPDSLTDHEDFPSADSWMHTTVTSPENPSSGYGSVTVAHSPQDGDEASPDAVATQPSEAPTPEPADAAPQTSDSAPEQDGGAPADQPFRPLAPPTVMVEPALLRTVRLEPYGEDDAYITLTAKCEVNPVVLRALRSHGISADAISGLRTLAADPASEDEALASIRELGRAYLPGFTYEVRMLLGSFVHPGQVLLSDLEAMKPYIEASGIMSALAGDEATRKLSAAPVPPADASDRAPEGERGAGDRDVAELATIDAVASGRSLVIDAPPGSERVETLASIIADATASGRSVLYIPGRASSRRALIDSMDTLGLSDLTLDFSNLDDVAMRLRTGLRLRGDKPDNDPVLNARAELVNARKGLGEYIDELHKVDPVWGESVYTLLQRLASLTVGHDAPKSQVRLDRAATVALAQSFDDERRNLAEAAELGMLTPGSPDAAWAGARIRSEEEGQVALRRAGRLANETVPVLMAQSQRVAGETGLTRATNFSMWLEQINMLEGLSTTLDVFVPKIYERSAADMVIATATREWREKHGEDMKGSERRRLTKQAKDLVRPGAQVANLHEELVKVQRQREVWRRYSNEGGWPRLPDGMSQIKATAGEAVSEIRALEEILPAGARLVDKPFEDLIGQLRVLAAGSSAMATVPRRNELLSHFKEAGLDGLVEDLTKRSVSIGQIDAELELVYASSIFEQLVRDSRALAEIGPGDLTRLSTQLRELDKRHTKSLVGPVRRAAIRIMRETISKRRDETMKLDRQLERYSTGALRDAIAAHPRLVQVARPAWVVPSMMVAEFIPPMPWADLVIVDEMDSASCASAVPMLMRGRQIVVMGDLRRADKNSAVAQFAKVLPVCELPTLRAKYDELASQTLREQGYADVLKMVPAVPHNDHARLVVVNGRGVPSPATGTVEGVQAEVDAVIDAVVNHTLVQPELSLAVVCVSEVHAGRVREAIKETVAKSSVLGALTITDVREPFTVVDITQCAGLRRDSIILSVGYGKTVHGRVLHSFGSLATPAGVTGLVEAVGAAREELTIISSIGPGEIGMDNVTTPGPRLLAKLIDRAGGQNVLLEAKPLGGPTQPLIRDLASKLKAKGWSVAFNYGYADGVTIPLAVGDTSLQGTWRVAVVYDDEAYVAERSQRRRDRYWAERLEARGWTVFQTFSTSLFIDLEGQTRAISAILEHMRESVRSAGAAALAPLEVPHLDEEWSAPSANDVPEAVVTPEAASENPVKPDSVAIPRSSRPNITPGLPLAAYSDDQLDEIVRWISSDAIPRSEEELVAAMRDELDLHRRGVQIDAVLRNVVLRSGLTKQSTGEAISHTDTATQGIEALNERLTGQFPRIELEDSPQLPRDDSPLGGADSAAHDE